MKQLLNWGVFGLVLLGVYVVAGPAQLGGPVSYVIVDGPSMEPTYDDGDLVLARQQPSYEVGDVITYDAPVDRQFNVIHRIVERVDGGYRTQGDNRDEPDGWIAPDDAIHGASWLHLPSGGGIVAFLRQPHAILALLAGLAAFEYVKRSERKKTLEQREPTGVAS